ncbi:MAG TPA: hypothetical protein PKL37_23655 [Panacibacter sp.]|nr:hypothetical protein [Panacibacter sp.]
MKFFKRHRTDVPETHAWQDKAAVRIYKLIHQMQTGFASFMSRKFNHLTIKKKKTVFILLFILIGGLSVYQIIHGIFSDSEIGTTVKIDKINFPVHNSKSNIERIKVTEKDYQSIASFRHYMDSLNKILNGKYQYDSILQARPGLMDSVQVLEQLYLSQQKH